MNKRIVFDAGGVLFAGSSKEMTTIIASYKGLDADALYSHYHEHMHIPLMRGDSDEETFWSEILAHAGVDSKNKDEIKGRFLDEALYALPAVRRIPEWAEKAELWILSNHRHEWLVPRLEGEGIRDYFERILVSSELGSRKPEKQAFQHLTDSSLHSIYVDDKQRNLDEAALLGYDTLLADPEGKWIARLDAWVNKPSKYSKANL